MRTKSPTSFHISGDKVSDLLQYILYATKSSAFRLLISLPDAPKNQPEMNSSKLINEASERKRCLMRAILLGSSVSSTSAVAAAYQLPRIARIHQARLSMLVFCVKRRKERQNRLIRYASRHEGTHVFIFSCADLL